MSVIDDLRGAQQQALARLNELKPLVAEYEELRREIERLGLSPNTIAAPHATNKPRTSHAKTPERRRARSSKPAASAAATAATPSATAAKSTSKATRTPGGSRSTTRAEDIAGLVTQQPGITVADIGRTLGVNATSLYTPVRRLVSDGRLRKEGTALHPAP